MTTQTFLIALGIGAALIAFWLAIRFPDRAPGDFRRAILHVLLALGAGWFAGDLFTALVAHGFAVAVAAVFVVVLPVVVYMFLAGAWFLKLTHDTIARYH
jgi:uncharacterized transporter YbjL